MDSFKVIEAELIYNGPIFKLVNQTVHLPNGKTAPRSLILHNGASAVIPVLNDGRILLIRQYRDAVKTEIWEVPAGRLDEGEEPAHCARRELEEETGYRAERIRFITKFFPAVGYSNEQIHLFLAEGLTPGPTHWDEDEFIQPEAFTLDEALRLVDDGAVVDGKTILALLTYARMKQFKPD